MGAVAAAQNAATTAAGLAPTQTFGAITDGTTISGNAGVNVISASSITLNNGNLTLSGNASQTFIIDVAGNITVNGGANSSILLSGGVNPNNVLFNVTGGNNVTFTGGGTLNGTFLDLTGSISVHDKTLNGALIGGQGTSISDTSGFMINHPVPEPSSFVLLGLGAGAGLVGAARRRRIRVALAA
jgi:hypothetical protein